MWIYLHNSFIQYTFVSTKLINDMTEQQKQLQRIGNDIFHIQNAYTSLRENIRELNDEDLRDELLDESGQIFIAFERLEEIVNDKLNRVRII